MSVKKYTITSSSAYQGNYIDTSSGYSYEVITPKENVYEKYIKYLVVSSSVELDNNRFFYNLNKNLEGKYIADVMFTISDDEDPTRV